MRYLIVYNIRTDSEHSGGWARLQAKTGLVLKACRLLHSLTLLTSFAEGIDERHLLLLPCVCVAGCTKARDSSSLRSWWSSCCRVSLSCCAMTPAPRWPCMAFVSSFCRLLFQTSFKSSVPLSSGTCLFHSQQQYYWMSPYSDSTKEDYRFNLIPKRCQTKCIWKLPHDHITLVISCQSEMILNEMMSIFRWCYVTIKIIVLYFIVLYNLTTS